MDSRISFSHDFKSRMLVLAIIIGLVISVTMPMTYLVLTIMDKRNLAAIHSHDIARKMTESVRDNPILWMYDAPKITQIESDDHGKGIAAVYIFDRNYTLIQKLDLLTPSYIELSKTCPVKYNNQVYGFVKVTQESDSILQFTAVLFSAFSFLGVLIAVFLYKFPTGMVVKAEKEILQAYRELHYITFSLGEGVCVTDLKGKFTFTNPAAERMLGWQRGGLLGLQISDIFFNNLSEGHKASPVMQIIEQGESRRVYEDSLVRKDGSRLPVSYVISPIKENHQNTGFVIVYHDITRRKQIEMELRSRETALRRITDNMLDMISQTDVEGIIRYVTPSYEHVLGYKSDDLLGKSFLDFIHEDDKNFVMASIKNSLVSSGLKKSEFRFKHANGEYLWIESLSSLLTDNNGQGIIFCTRDIHDRKYLQQEVARLDRLHLIGEMAAGIGHEIRNPMTTVRGFLQMLSGKKENFSYKEYYNLMIGELDRANSIIKEYLNLAKNKTINIRLQNLNEVIDTIYPLMQADAILADKRVILELSNIPDLPIDEKEIRQLILNLVRNGLEAMQQGGCVVIKTTMETDKGVVLSVHDQGNGIDSGVLEKLGTPFFTTKEQGTGLGLAVCYSIAARHNAKIEIASGDTGSIFSVRFFIESQSVPNTSAG